jgi:uncharacterized protein YndB with AHSA1/START domain
MSANLIAKSSVTIDASVARVWDALTNPDLIKKYFYGSKAVTDWKVGSPIEFIGEWEGKTYVDKGVILKNEPEKLFQYTYFSSFSNLPDVPENYNNITYELHDEAGQTVLNVKQENIENEEKRQHSEKGWGDVLHNLKQLLEK